VQASAAARRSPIGRGRFYGHLFQQASVGVIHVKLHGVVAYGRGLAAVILVRADLVFADEGNVGHDRLLPSVFEAVPEVE